MIDYAFGKWLRFKLRYYLQNKNGTFPELPSYEKELTVRRTFIHPVLHSISYDHDVDGNGWKDLFLMPDKKHCEIYLFDKQKKEFPKRPIRIAIKSPDRLFGLPLITDINDDDTKDIAILKTVNSKKIVEIFLLNPMK